MTPKIVLRGTAIAVTSSVSLNASSVLCCVIASQAPPRSWNVRQNIITSGASRIIVRYPSAHDPEGDLARHARASSRASATPPIASRTTKEIVSSTTATAAAPEESPLWIRR